MTVEEFAHHHRGQPRKIDSLVSVWVAEKELHDFLGTSVMAGVTLGDLLIGDGLLDQIPEEVRRGFEGLMESNADSLAEIRSLIHEKAALGPESIRGLISKIQGQLGENRFVALTEGARLAASGNQEGWDVAVDRADGTQYFQIKVYENPHAAVEALREVQAKAQAGEL